MEEAEREAPGPSGVRREGRRIRRKTKPAAEEVMMIRKAKTLRGREKQLEKELPWEMIPEEKKDEFRRAEQTQWDEHVMYNALEGLPEPSADTRTLGAPTSA